MAAKKKRGLSGTVEQHRDHAKIDYQSAKESFKDAMGALRDKPACHTALSHYSMGLEDFGAYQSNYVDGRLGENVDGALQLKDLNSLRKKTLMAFQKSCLAPSSLSGMKRRSRR